MDCLLEQTHPELLLKEDKQVRNFITVDILRFSTFAELISLLSQLRYTDILFTEQEVYVHVHVCTYMYTVVCQY